MKRSHPNLLNIGQIKKYFFEEHPFLHGELQFRKKSSIGAKEILVLVYI